MVYCLSRLTGREFLMSNGLSWGWITVWRQTLHCEYSSVMFLLENIVVAAKTFSCFHTKEPLIVCCIEKIQRKSTYSFETHQSSHSQRPVSSVSVILGPNLINWIRIKAVKELAGRWSNGTLHITRVTPGHRGRDQWPQTFSALSTWNNIISPHCPLTQVTSHQTWGWSH